MTDKTRTPSQYDNVFERALSHDAELVDTPFEQQRRAEAAERRTRLIELASSERAQPNPPEVGGRLARMSELAREVQDATLNPEQVERLARMNELSDINTVRTPEVRNTASSLN